MVVVEDCGQKCILFCITLDMSLLVLSTMRESIFDKLSLNR
jgi:hypothetical protein